MSGLERLFILFDRPSKAFFPEETVTGTVEVILTQPVKLNEITIRLLGEAKVKWTETEPATYYVTNSHGQTTTQSGTRSVACSSSKSYFDRKMLLWSPDGVNNGCLPAGNHSFYFSLNLPPHIPSSFEGSYGSIRYSAEAIFNASWRINKKCKVPFFVATVFDLNLIPSVMEPVPRMAEKYLCCLCCRSGPIFVIASTERGGYVPGELLRTNVEVVNRSNKDVGAIKITLLSKVQYHARGRTRTETKELLSVKGGKIVAGDADTWTSDPIQIPPLPPSGLENCSIIDISYEVMVTVIPSGISVEFDIFLPIKIGSIPIGPAGVSPPTPVLTAPEFNYDNAALPSDYSDGTTNREKNFPSVHNYGTINQ